MNVELTARVEVLPDTLLREVDGETVLLNLKNGHYYSLDEVGTAVWRAVTSSASVDAAVASLLEEFDVDRPTLERDVGELLGELCDEGLIRVSSTPTP